MKGMTLVINVRFSKITGDCALSLSLIIQATSRFAVADDHGRLRDIISYLPPLRADQALALDCRPMTVCLCRGIGLYNDVCVVCIESIKHLEEAADGVDNEGCCKWTMLAWCMRSKTELRTEVESDGCCQGLLDGEASLGLGGANLLVRELWWCDWPVNMSVSLLQLHLMMAHHLDLALKGQQLTSEHSC